MLREGNSGRVILQVAEELDAGVNVVGSQGARDAAASSQAPPRAG